MPTPYDNCKSLVKTCDEFHKDPFKQYLPDTWYYRWWYVPKCGAPDYEKHFQHVPDKQYCMDMMTGKKPFNKVRFEDSCIVSATQEPLLKKYTLPPAQQKKKKSSWWSFFLFWKKETQTVQQQTIALPLLKHKKLLKKQVDSGHGLFLLVGNAFLIHRHPSIVLYDPFFDRHQHFDIKWFARLSNVPGSYYLFNLLYSQLSLKMEVQELENPFRWVVKSDNFDQFQFYIDETAHELHVEVSSPLLSTFRRSYPLDNKQFLCFPVLVKLPGGFGHVTSLVYHLQKQTWEHFESNGYIWYLSDHMDDYLQTRVSTLIHLGSKQSDRYLPMKKFIRVKDITPQPSFQQLDKAGKIEAIDVGDYCATWTYWYLNVRFSNPRNNPPFIVKKIIEGVEKQEKLDTYIVFIRSYAIVIGRIIEELHQVFSSYYIKSWFSNYQSYQEKVREIFNYYITNYF